MLRQSAFASALLLLALAACTHLVSDPPVLPAASDNPEWRGGGGFNGGRVQSIAVSPGYWKSAIVAMEFGGLWQTTNGGDKWFRVFSLPAEMVTDVEFGADGETVVATVFRDNQTVNGGGIYVSRNRGGSWILRGVVPSPGSSAVRTSAYSVSRAPDEERVWYAATDYGVAISRNNGTTWSHVAPYMLAYTRSPLIQSVLALTSGRVLALGKNALYRSDDHGTTWREVVRDDRFDFFTPAYGGNKMDRSPYEPWAFILAEYHYNKDEPDRGAGSLYFYDLDTDILTLLPTPQGFSRGPFVRVSSDSESRDITVWLGHGWDGYKVTRRDAAEFHALAKSDWVSFIATTGIPGVHSDMSDMGVDGQHRPRLMGSDGGVFKPREGSDVEWVTAATPESGMNSLQITDLAGTNFITSAGTTSSTSLYFSTQDNWIWASPDGGRTWPRHDCSEGFDIEARSEVRLGEPAAVGYVEIGCDWTEQLADANLVNQRPTPDVDQNGQPLDAEQMRQAFYLEQTSGGAESGWLRLRTPKSAAWSEVYVSQNSGANWRQRFDLNFRWAGSVQRTSGGTGVLTEGVSARLSTDAVQPREGGMAWLAVYSGRYVGTPSGSWERIGLVPLSSVYADRIDTIDDSDVVLLPGTGSLGRVAAQWDSHAVFGADPYDWRFLIAPDVLAGDVKVSRDGGQSWTTDHRLTAQALKLGQLLMRDGDDYHMQVTEIAFDPYRNGRILVGTRDAGIVCTADDGQTWYTIKNSDRIGYITGFHFYPNGAVHIASWGHGLWFLRQSEGCSKTNPPLWRREPVEGSQESGGVLSREIGAPPAPQGIADPDIAKLFLSANAPMSGMAVLGLDNQLVISGRGFPARITIALVVGENHKSTVEIADDGQFSTTLELPLNLPYGVHSIEAVLESSGEVLAVAEFAKSFAEDEELEGEREREREIQGEGREQG